MNIFIHPINIGVRFRIFTKSHLPSIAPSSSFHRSFCDNSSVHDNEKIRELRAPEKKDIEYFSSIFDYRPGSVLTELSDVEKYNSDWTSSYKGSSNVVLKPKNTGEISSILQYCNYNGIGIVPQGGNTGLVGGSVPTIPSTNASHKDYRNESESSSSKEIILSMEHLTKIHHFDSHNGILICDAGCVLQDLQTFLESQQPNPHLFPLDIGAKGSCQIGGNVSTNAGGQYYYRFGSLHANVLGLEAVTADGSVLNLMNSNRKDNTGYDLKHLFIGSEGTLGIVTKVSISCPRLPSAKNATFLGLDSIDDVLEVLALAKLELGEILSAFELMDKGILDLVTKQKHVPIKMAGGQNYKFSLLIETQGSIMEHDLEKMESFIEKCFENGYVKDGILCQDGKQIEDMWQIRESCNPIFKDVGYNYKYDISVPISEFYTVAEDVKSHLEAIHWNHALVVVWGHLIDGNAHLNVAIPGKYEVDPQFSAWLENTVYESVMQLNGSISAEHGIGQSKRDYLLKVKDQLVLNLMYDVKKLLDPNGILNPGKYLPY